MQQVKSKFPHFEDGGADEGLSVEIIQIFGVTLTAELKMNFSQREHNPRKIAVAYQAFKMD